MEEKWLLLLPAIVSSVFIPASFLRWLRLRQEDRKLVDGHHGFHKLSVAAALAAVQLMHLVAIIFRRSQSLPQLVSLVLDLIAFTCLCPLLYLEHVRSLRPADVIVVFLMASMACDIGVLIATKQPLGMAAHSLAAPNILLKTLLAAIESRDKAPMLRSEYARKAPSQRAGILSRTFFWWMNSFLALGNHKILKEDDLPPLDEALSSRSLRQRALKAWDRRAKPDTKSALPLAILRSVRFQFLGPVIPRLSLIVFRYAQPVLIGWAIRSTTRGSDDSGKLVVIGAAVVYVGLAISKALYQHRIDRLKLMVRGAIVGLINNKALEQQPVTYEDGRAVTLMSTDAEGVGESASMFHEFWAQLIEVFVGFTMLAHGVGWAAPVPLVIIFFCSRMSRYLAKTLPAKQKAWNAATQQRIAMTTSMLSSVKGMKILGLSEEIEDLIKSLRQEEMHVARKVRWMRVAYNASANALGIFAPIITFVVFVLVAGLRDSKLDTEMAFTTVALLGLITHPANMIMTIVPQAMSSLAAFERIRDYLSQPPRTDQRGVVQSIPLNQEVITAITINDVTIQPDAAASPILSNVNINVHRGSIVIISGPVGSGKTMLSRCLLGELKPTSGSVTVSTKYMAYCDQTPWLPSGTIKQAICGFGLEDCDWYAQVIRLCCLDEDIAALPDGHDTAIGNRGSNLSGGQRQRLALARAVYARCDIVLLDDPFSALDGRTEQRIVHNLFGIDGHFRKLGTTVVLTASSSAHFHFASWLVVLVAGSVEYQGTWQGLERDTDISSKVQLREKEHHQDTGEEKDNISNPVQSRSLKVSEAISDLSRATGDFSLYEYYFDAAKRRNVMILLACTATYSFFITFPQYILQKWTEAPGSQASFYIASYVIASFLAWTATNGSMASTHLLIAPQSGIEMHRRLLSTIVGARLSYFSSTDTGSILNRFSQDMQLVDNSLPHAILTLSTQVFKLVVQIGLLYSAQKLLTATLPICVIVVYVVQKVYLRTSRQLRLLDLESQSAVYSSFLESIEGVVTIRAFGWVKQVAGANMYALDRSQQPAYMLLCLQRWLGIVLDLMVAGIATGLIALAVSLNGTTTAGQIGMALNIVLVANTTLLALVNSWTNMEISLGAISRLKTLEANTPPEEEGSEVPNLSFQPSSGTLEFDKVTVSYKDPESPALKEVSLNVADGQHLVVCGRTGSGKSTLLLSLLRLLDIQKGTITVNGIDLGQIPRRLVRGSVFITVAQEPFMLGQASLRFNLDPTKTLPDEAIIVSLQQTSLWTHFNKSQPSEFSSPPEGVLDDPLASLEPLSTGQVQLFALARAILRRQVLVSSDSPYSDVPTKPILLLDEATSSVDPETESIMRKIVKEVFTDSGHTIVAITHRLGGLEEVMRPGQDIVATLAEGRIEGTRPIEEVIG